MAWTQQDYQRLGDYIVGARVEIGLDRKGLADAADVTLRTLADVETGQLRSRKTFSAESLASIGKALGWAPGTWRKILDNPDAPAPHQQLPLIPDMNDQPAPENDQPPPNTLLYRRPDGLTDAEWENLMERSREYHEFLIQQAAKER